MSLLETSPATKANLAAGLSLPVANGAASLPAVSSAPISIDSPTVDFSAAGTAAGSPELASNFEAGSIFGQAYLLGNSDVQKPTVVQAYLVDQDKIALRVETSDIVFGTQVPYEAQPQDEIFVQGINTWVSRDGTEIGYLVGKERDILRTFDEFVGEPLDWSWADNPLSYSISASNDANFTGGVNPEAVFRKTKPVEMGSTSVYDRKYSLSHTLYLDLPQDIIAGQTYTVDFAGDVLADLTFTFDERSSISEAVHVTQVGFRSDDPVKQGYLSTWMGDGGAIAYDPGLKFQLVDNATSDVVFEGTVELDKSVYESEVNSYKNFALADVYTMDFSDFNQSGTYRLAVEGVGSSLPFDIGDSTWSDAFRTSARGFYYQRSGIALEQPYADRDRPRAFHPDDGVKVYQSGASLMDLQLDPEGTIDNIFTELTAQATDEVLPDAWGGYYDAGDWDRRIDHLEASRAFIELAELYPDFYSDLELNIPESGNQLPDVIDEALWGLDLFKRLQKPDGGIPGGIESAEHPKAGETSWQESHVVYAFAPDMWSSYLYAATAAQAAHWLNRNGFAELGQEYLDSALRAMAFAEQELANVGGIAPYTEVGDARNLAALSLFQATEELAWHQLFLDTSSFFSDGAELFEFLSHNQRDAAFLYARMDFEGQDQRVKANATEAILIEASESITFSEGNSFNWTQENAFAPVVWEGGLGSTNVETILRAHWLTDNSVFLEYGILGTQVAMGANPDNMTYTTGLGWRNPENPLLINDRVLGEEPVPGITLYGPNNLDMLGDFFLIDQIEGLTFPNIRDWPTLESYLDLYLFVPGSELTLHQSMVPTTYALGYLAARETVGTNVGGIETVQSFLRGEQVDLNPKDGLNNPIQKLLVDNDNYQLQPGESSLAVDASQGLLRGDNFDPKKPITIVIEDMPSAGGGIFVNDDGSFFYIPPAGFSGIETMTYRISNGVEQSSLATVSFGVGTDIVLPQDTPVDDNSRGIRPSSNAEALPKPTALPSDELTNADGQLPVSLESPISRPAISEPSVAEVVGKVLSTPPAPTVAPEEAVTPAFSDATTAPDCMVPDSAIAAASPASEASAEPPAEDSNSPAWEVVDVVAEAVDDPSAPLSFTELLSDSPPDIAQGDFGLLMPSQFNYSFLDWVMDWVEAELEALLPPEVKIDIDIDIDIDITLDITLPPPPVAESPRAIRAWQRAQQTAVSTRR